MVKVDKLIANAEAIAAAAKCVGLDDIAAASHDDIRASFGRSKMTSDEQAKISRLRRRYERLSSGVDEDDAVLISITKKLAKEYGALAETEIRIKTLKKEVRKLHSLRQTCIDEMREIENRLHAERK